MLLEAPGVPMSQALAKNEEEVYTKTNLNYDPYKKITHIRGPVISFPSKRYGYLYKYYLRKRTSENEDASENEDVLFFIEVTLQSRTLHRINQAYVETAEVKILDWGWKHIWGGYTYYFIDRLGVIVSRKMLSKPEGVFVKLYGEYNVEFHIPSTYTRGFLRRVDFYESKNKTPGRTL